MLRRFVYDLSWPGLQVDRTGPGGGEPQPRRQPDRDRHDRGRRLRGQIYS